jgi:hypothetical protein
MCESVGGDLVFQQKMVERLLGENDQLVFQHNDSGELILFGELYPGIKTARPIKSLAAVPPWLIEKAFRVEGWDVPIWRNRFRSELWDKRQAVQDWRLRRRVIRPEGVTEAATAENYPSRYFGSGGVDFAKSIGKDVFFSGAGALLWAGELVGRGLFWAFRGLLRNPIEGVFAGLAEKYGVRELGLPKLKLMKETEKEKREWKRGEIEKRIRKQ